MSATEPCAALTSDGVDLIDEDDARCGFLRLLKEIAHARGTNTDKHLDEVGAADREELDARLAGNRLGEEGLTCTRGAEEQDPLWNTRTEVIEFFGGLEELDNLLKLLLRPRPRHRRTSPFSCRSP